MSSDISDVDEDSVQPTKKADFQNLCKVASKGWDTCFLGFNENFRNLMKPTSKRSLPPESTVHSVICQDNSLTTDGLQLKRHSLPSALQRGNCLRDANLSVVEIPQKLSSKYDNQSPLNLAKENLSLKISKVLKDFDSATKTYSSPKRRKNSIERCKVERAKRWTFSDFCDSFDLLAKQQISSPPISEGSSTDSFGLKSEQKSIHSVGSASVVESDDNESPLICTYSPSLSVKEGASSPTTEGKMPHKVHTHVQSEEHRTTPDGRYVKDEMPEANDKNKLANFLRGSDWLQTIKWQKDNTTTMQASHYEDKSYKAPKFISGGFAEQAWKLESKERTARVIWSHKKSEKSEKLIHKSLTLMLQTYHAVDGFVISKCKVVKSSVLLPSSPTRNSFNDSSSNVSATAEQDLQISRKICEEEINNCAEDVENEKNIDEFVVLLLKQCSLNNLHLSCGSVIQLYPPWQSLNIPNIPYKVILCAYFIEVVKATPEDKDLKKSAGLSEVVIFSRDYNLASHLFTHQQRFRRRAKTVNNVYSKAAGIQLISKYFKPVSDLNNQGTKEATDPCMPENCATSDVSNTSLDISPVYSSGSKISLCAKVQRIWSYRITDNNSLYLKTAVNNPPGIRYSLLLQDKNCKFWELQLENCNKLSEDSKWLYVLSKGEGKCFKFEDIKIAEKLQSSKHVNLFSFVKSMLDKQQKSSLTSSSLYKVRVCCIQSSVTDVSDSLFPQYIAPEILPLNMLIQAGSYFRRFSCVAKIICEVNCAFYVTDTSLHNKKFNPYIKLQFHLSSEKPDVSVGSIMFIKEATVCKDMLAIDKYAKAIVLTSLLSRKVSDELHHFAQQKELLKSVKELLFLRLQYFQFKPLNKFSEILDLVIVEGQVVSVDRETAVSWLQCNVCSKESLYEDMKVPISKRTVDLPLLSMIF